MTFLTQVEALNKHQDELLGHVENADAWSQKPLSSIDADECNSFLDEEKAWVSMVEHDCRDAKRRVNLKKGPKPKAAPKPTGEESGSDDEVSD